MSSVTQILTSHFDSYQRGKIHSNELKEARKRALLIRKDIAKLISAKGEEEVNNEAEIQEVNVTESVEDLMEENTEMQVDLLANKMSTMALVDDIGAELGEAALKMFDVAISYYLQGTKSNENNYEESCDRILLLAAVLCSELKEASCANLVIAKAIMFSSVPLENLRAKSCYFLGLCLKSLQFSHRRIKKKYEEKSVENIRVNEDIFWRKICIDKIRMTLQKRVIDKHIGTRLMALQASRYIFFLQEYEEMSMYKHDSEVPEATTELVNLIMQRVIHDTSLTCRISAMKSIPINQKTITCVISRVRDVKEKVRVSALETLMKVDLNFLTSAQCCAIIQYGITERCPSTREATVKLICNNWMKAAKFDIVTLLNHLDPANNEKISELCVREVFSVMEESGTEELYTERVLDNLSEAEISMMKENLLFKNQSLSLELTEANRVLAKRIKCESIHFSQNLQRTNLISDIMFDVHDICEALQHHISKYYELIKAREATSLSSPRSNGSDSQDDTETNEDTTWFLCVQLLKISKFSDIQEAGSRKLFENTLHNILSSNDTPDELIEECVKAFAWVFMSESEFLSATISIIQVLLDPTENIEHDDIGNNQLSVLVIISTLLEYIGSRSSNEEEWYNLFELILSASTSTNSQIRELSVTCLGKFGLLSDPLKVSSDIVPVMENICSNEKEIIEIRVKAAMSMCDLVMLFSKEFPEKHEQYFNFLEKLLVHDEKSVVAVSTEICTKLFISGVLKNSEMFGRLVVIFFDENFDNSSRAEEIDVDEIGSVDRLQQILSTFFPKYSSTECSRAITKKCTKHVLYYFLDIFDPFQRSVKATSQLNKIIDFVRSLPFLGYETANPSDYTVDNASQETMDIMCDIAEFITENCDLPKIVLRALCKYLGKVNYSVMKDKFGVRKFRKQMENLEILIRDAKALDSVKNILESVVVETEGHESEVDVTEKVGEINLAVEERSDDDWE